MNLMGYLVTIANIQSFAGLGGPLQDISVRVSELHRLAEEMRSMPEFPIEGFSETGFYRVGNVGKYLSQNLRDFIYKGNQDPRDEGVILSLYFSNQANNYYDTEGNNGALTYFMPRIPVSEDDRDDIDDYLSDREKRATVAW